ncbi:MAG: RagB/SusD family nutrient uptake outer membrane protein [Massilibacteroides sp.]|nr:RagB/SusD family nutrient uptake outer membrane protein [Massilibacteroides sp.]
MKYLNKTIIAAVACTFLLITSCDMERSPLDQFSTTTFWDSPDNAELALTGCYKASNVYNSSGFVRDWWAYNGMIFMDFASDNAYDRRGDNSGYFRMVNGTLQSNNAHVRDYWKVSYAKISRCNIFLDGMETNFTGDAAKGTQWIGEARFIRATQYFYLSQYFQNVPLVTKPFEDTQDANNVALSSKAEIVTFVIDELKKSVEELASYSVEGRAHANKQAALAFLGRMYLAEKRFTEAAEVYKQIIDMGENDIDPDYASIFTDENEASTENIFSSQYLQDLAGSALPQHCWPAQDGGWCIMCPLGDLFESYQFTDGTDFDFNSPLYDSSNLTENRDPRLGYTLITNKSMFRGKEYICDPDAKTSDRVMGGQTTQTGFLMRKFSNESYSGNMQRYGGDVPVIRYAEVLLSYLEAKLEAGDAITQDLLDATINKVRGRASVNMPPITETNSSLLRPILRNERRVEMALEGTRLWDLFRWHTAIEELNGDVWGCPFPDAVRKSNKEDAYGRWYVSSRQFRESDYKWPIPQTEQDINPNLR